MSISQPISIMISHFKKRLNHQTWWFLGVFGLKKTVCLGSSPSSTFRTEKKSVDAPILSDSEIQAMGRELDGLAAQLSVNPKASDALKQGEQASRFLGSGLEYEESRLYQPGDELRRLHWRLMARTGQAYTKLFQEERQEAWTLLVDQRLSMRFGTKIRLKVTQAVRAAGAFAWQAQQAELPVNALAMAEGLRQSPVYEGRAAFEEIVDFLSIPCPPRVASELSLFNALMTCQQQLQSGARLIICSDFQDLDEACLALLANLQPRVKVKAIFISDPVERALPELDGIRLAAIGQTADYALTSEQRKAYGAWAQAYFSKRQAQLASVGVSVLPLRTDQGLETCLQALEVSYA